MKQILERDPGRQVRRGVDRREPRRPQRTSSELREAGKTHQIEKVGDELRAMMPWISAGKQSVEDASGGALDDRPPSERGLSGNSRSSAKPPTRSGGSRGAEPPVRYIVSSKLTSPTPRRAFLSSLPLALRGSLSVRSST